MIKRKIFYIISSIFILIICSNKLSANGDVTFHAEWDYILKKYVHEGKVDYNKIISLPDDLKRLNKYFESK